MITDSAGLRRLIRDAAASRPRDHQANVGASEIGHPCPRRLGHRIIGTPKVNTDIDPLASWLGTAAHKQLEDYLKTLPDWEAEIAVELPAYGITGTVDAYHKPSRTAYDWKFPGDGANKRARRGGPSEQYMVQIHAYALALSLTGRPVDLIGIGFVPRTGRLADAHLWGLVEPDESVVEAALRRYESITALATPATVGLLPTADAFCDWCPWFLPAATDPAEACPGHST